MCVRPEFAKCFTPQFGDCFIEMMRAQLARVLCSRFGFGATCAQFVAGGAEALCGWNTTTAERACVAATPNHGLAWDHYARNGASLVEILACAKSDMVEALRTAAPETLLMDALFDAWRHQQMATQ